MEQKCPVHRSQFLLRWAHRDRNIALFQTVNICIYSLVVKLLTWIGQPANGLQSCCSSCNYQQPAEHGRDTQRVIGLRGVFSCIE